MNRFVSGLLLTALCLLPRFAALGQFSSFTLSSPDNQVQATIKVVDRDLFYNVTRGGETVIEDSRLGLVMQAGSEDLGSGIDSILQASPITSVNQSYAAVGWHPTATNNYNGQTFATTKAGTGNDSAVEFRVFNDGLAFRYAVPNEGGSGPRTVLGEATQWKFPATATNSWYQTGTMATNDPNFDYANLWTTNPISTLAGRQKLLGPIVIKYGTDGYVAVTESDYWGYSGMSYTGIGSSTIKAAFLNDSAGWSVPSGSTSPWRTVTTSAHLNGLVNSDIITNVARPADATLYPAGVNTPWITYGRSLWSFLDRNNVNFDGTPATNSGVNTTNMKAYIDKAAALGFEYVTVDSGWEARPWINRTGWTADGGVGGLDNNASFVALGDLVAYAHSKDIKIIAWKDSHDFYSGDLATGNFNDTDAETWLTKLDSIGVDGVKMDFLRQAGHLVGEQQRLLNFMATTYEEAAERQLALVFHGAPKVAGQQRSFPNSISTEDLRGLEVGAVAGHDAALPFTTLLSGHSDYTPGLFSPADDPSTPSFNERGRRDNTTWAHQMAMGVLITSPVIHWASGPTTIENALPNGSHQLEVFKEIAATWDETVVLDISQIGTLAAFARRDGDVWFLAMVSGDPTNPMTINNLDLSFLGNGFYEGTFLFDGVIDEQFLTSVESSLDSTFDLDVTMRRGGGFVAKFVPVPEPSTLRIFGLALAGLAWMCRRRRSRRVV